ncbi:putative serine/threonine-protein kinase PBL23 [Salvia divinorum]|uniref:Serine/threonine-protein kinase PBL23 n=1 Tax=Salvia divinorum TaxID=28513 RepID=A0ABD1GD58_SALDI
MAASSSSAKQRCRTFSLMEIKSATNNFSGEREIGEGFGKVYRGFIDKCKTMVAVKRLDKASVETPSRFDVEIAALSQIRHRNIVSLIGYCKESGEKILVYEYIANHTLEDHLHKLLKDGRSELSWNERLTILIGVARGLYYLQYCVPGGSFKHRDVKSSNILLDDNFVAKITDFGKAKHVSLDDPHNHVSTAVIGAFGYVNPYYYLFKRLTRDSDTYSFGLMVFEVLSGRRAVDGSRPKEERFLTTWIFEKEAREILDPVFHGNVSEYSLEICCNVAERCLNYLPKRRPEMSEVLAQLELALLASQNGLVSEKIVNMPPLIADLAIPLAELEKVNDSFGCGTRGSTVYYAHYGTRQGPTHVAIKQYKCQLPQQAFLAQVLTLSKLNHENVAKLHRFCMTRDMDYYVYEFASGRSLHDILHEELEDVEQPPYLEIIPEFPWAKRIKIAVEAAKGLCYIHDEKALIHRNIKSSNVLIFNGGSSAKITDLHICNPCSCNFPPIRGGRPPCELYHPPEYSKDGDSQGGDVYSFGIVLLELLTGKKPLDPTLPQGMNLVSWATPQLTNDEGIRMVMDHRVGDDYPFVAVKKMAATVVLCLANEPILRPTMNEVLIDLQEALHETQNYCRNLEQGARL